MQIEMNFSQHKAVARALKVEGQDRAERGAGDAWMEDALIALEAYLEVVGTAAFPIEQFRAWAVPRVIDPPRSHKVWGSIPRRAVAAGLIETVVGVDGKPIYWQASSPQTHAHPVRIYRRKPK